MKLYRTNSLYFCIVFIIPMFVFAIFNVAFKLDLLSRNIPFLRNKLRPLIQKLLANQEQALAFVSLNEILTGIFMIINIFL